MNYLLRFVVVALFALTSLEAQFSLPDSHPLTPLEENKLQEVTCSLEEEDDKPKEEPSNKEEILECVNKLLRKEVKMLNITLTNLKLSKEKEIEDLKGLIKTITDENDKLNKTIEALKIYGPGDSKDIWEAAGRFGFLPSVVYWVNQDERNINKRDYTSWTPLMYAASKGHSRIAEFLVSRGAQMDAVDSFLGTTALMWASWYGHTDTVELLAKRGADMNIQDNWKQTALHRAVLQNQLEVVKVLIRNGADKNVKDNNGRTPLEKAESEGRTSIVKYLASI